MPPIKLRDFDRQTRALFNDIKKELNFTVGQLTIFGPKILNKSIKETLMKEKRLRHVIPHVDKFTVKTNSIQLPVVGKGLAIRFIQKQQTYKVRIVVTKANSSKKVFWSLAVAKGGRRALTVADLTGGNKAFGMRLKPSEVTSVSAALEERLRKKGAEPSGNVVVAVKSVGPVKPYYDWIFHSESRAFLETKKFLKRIETGKTIRSI